MSTSSQDAELPSNDSNFSFNGKNSDLARQLFFRAKAGDSASQINSLEIPSAVQDRLDQLKLEWKKLPGIAQRALLWDSGFGLTENNDPVQIWTLNGHSVADLAVPLDEYLSVGCEEHICIQPDNSTSFTNEWCGGAQMLKAARCVVKDFVDDSGIHAAMWGTGGNPQGIPTPHVRKHEWKDQRDDNSYVVFAIHTLDLADEPAWNACPGLDQNDGYGGLVVPCYTTANITEGIKENMTEVQGSPWVSQWLKEDYAATAKMTSSSHKTFNLMLLIPIIGGYLIVAGFVGIIVYVRHLRKEHAPEEALGPDPRENGTVLTVQAKRENTTSFTGTTNWAYEEEWSNLSLKKTLGSEVLVEKRLPFDSIIFNRVLSKGAYGEVWLADFLGEEVAVKRLLQTKSHLAEEVEDFAKEIYLSASLTHPNIVTFVGVAWNSLDNLTMVLEFFPLGDLQTYLRRSFDLLLWSKDKIHIVLGIALALQYLHSQSPPIIHRDLKSKNILITRNLEAKLSDFGLDTGKLPYHDALTAEGKNKKPFKILADSEAQTGSELPVNDSFAFDGSTSDIARQLYLRHAAGEVIDQVVPNTIPTTVTSRLSSLNVSFDILPGLLQRALLWDSGYVISPENDAVQVWTLGGRSMAKLAVSTVEYDTTGCTQMLTAAKCLMDNFDSDTSSHLAMWSNGGDPDMIPEIPLMQNRHTELAMKVAMGRLLSLVTR
ncbi:TKL protein kinase [Phytophthora palmivora]|uniref:TKL protein kinase n=1 Tax=Phytophthora palmivora TaxID=4796 RepID=A0A2P4Y6B5_9STRA|nr:TKL protein kinase [Phytophthora palmivora]